MKYIPYGKAPSEHVSEIQRLEDVEDGLREQIADQLRDLGGRDLRISGLQEENKSLWQRIYELLEKKKSLEVTIKSQEIALKEHKETVERLAKDKGHVCTEDCTKNSHTAFIGRARLQKAEDELEEIKQKLANVKDMLRIKSSQFDRMKEINKEPYDEGFKDGEISAKVRLNLITREELDERVKQVDALYQKRIESLTTQRDNAEQKEVELDKRILTLEKYLTQRTEKITQLEATVREKDKYLKDEIAAYDATSVRNSALFTQNGALKAEVKVYREHAAKVERERYAAQKERDEAVEKAKRRYEKFAEAARERAAWEMDAKNWKAEAEVLRERDAKSVDSDVNAVLSTFLQVLDEWVNGAIENHIASGHQDCMDSCANEFHIEDIRSMVEDTRNQLAAKPSAYYTYKAPYLVNGVMPTVQVYAERDALLGRVERLIEQRNAAQKGRAELQEKLHRIEEIAVDGD